MVMNIFDVFWKKAKLSAYYRFCDQTAVTGKWSDSENFPPAKLQMRGRYRNTWYWCMDEMIGEYYIAYKLYEIGKWKC